jgi:peptide/nickel transport system substrate-binding protein/oligopeptide transport system substrate-binding protein
MIRSFVLPYARTLGLSLSVLLLAACGHADGPLNVALIDEGIAAKASPDRTHVGLEDADFALQAATQSGLVSFDAEGRVVPSLAERWIVTPDGRSYIFRLRQGIRGGARAGDDQAASAQTVAQALRRAIAAQAGKPLGRDLLAIASVRAMADRVIEIDLAAPNPDLLTLLAQPELTLPTVTGDVAPGGGKRNALSPMVSHAEGTGQRLALVQTDGSERTSARGGVRALHVEFASAERAVDQFNAGVADVVLGGTIDSLPLASGARLARGNLQLDPVTGLYGLAVMRSAGFLAEAPNREALALAVDRDAMVARIAIDGWQPTTRLVAPGMEGDDGSVGERWNGVSLAQRRAQAAQRVALWRKLSGQAPSLTLAMPDGLGSRLVLAQLQADFASIGVILRAAPMRKDADLTLVDRVARYPRATWFLNQMACGAEQLACNPVGDALVAQAMREVDPRLRSQLLARAESEITAANGFIPLARPIRWFMARSLGGGIAPNPWGWHPLPPLAQGPG